MTQRLTPHQQGLCSEYTWLAETIASKISRNNAFLDKADAISDAMMGLIKATIRYDSSKGPFRVYARYVITGAIYDRIRDQDNLSDFYRRIASRIERARYKFTVREHRSPSNEELSQETTLSLESLQNYQQVISDSRPKSLESVTNTGDSMYDDGSTIANTIADPQDPYKEVNDEGDWQILDKLLDKLPGKERFILAMYYWEGMSLKDIGKTLGVSETRICQNKNSAIKKLRAWAPTELLEQLV